jgi:hypothetical protein
MFLTAASLVFGSIACGAAPGDATVTEDPSISVLPEPSSSRTAEPPAPERDDAGVTRAGSQRTTVAPEQEPAQGSVHEYLPTRALHND